ncbi:MAG: lysophospholipid acyltransferase family protein [Planctomycetes bacterium]|nr:lysophospholipid acyltransferase family protein [Planctomycetota bacterium]
MGLSVADALMPRTLATRCLDPLVYAAVRVAICVVQALPRDACERGARRLSRLLANRLRIRRTVVRDNLRTAFPAMTLEERRRTAEQMWEHLLLMVVEIAHANRVIHKTTWRKHLRIHGMEEMLRCLWLDRPKVILSGHYGNFELAAYLFGLFGLRIFSVARELDNPQLDRFVTEFRESRGQRILPKKGSAPDVAQVLDENGAIGLLGDQAAGPKGCWVEFFGRPASVHKAIGVFALSASAPVLVCSATRRGGLFDYDLRLEGVADPAAGGPESESLTALSQWYTTLLEQAIRREPAQYWWVHRRWRGSPRKAKKAKSRPAA